MKPYNKIPSFCFIIIFLLLQTLNVDASDFFRALNKAKLTSAERCSDIFKGLSFVVLAKSDGINSKETEKLTQTVHELNQTLFLGMPVSTSDLRILLVMTTDNPEYMVGDKQLIVPYLNLSLPAMLRVLVTRKPYFNTRPIFTHEYTHVIFDENLAQLNADWRSYISTVRKRKALEQQRDELFDNVKDRTSHVELEALMKKVTPIDEEIKLCQAELEGKAGLNKIVLPYTELFSDLAMIVDADNGKAAYRVEKGRGVKEEWARLRNYTIEHTLNESEEKDPHTLFNSSLSKLWSIYSNNPQLKKNKAQFMHSIFLALNSCIADRLQHPSVQVSNKELNNQLMKKIETELKMIEPELTF